MYVCMYVCMYFSLVPRTGAVLVRHPLKGLGVEVPSEGPGGGATCAL